jgi:hypothetical protein
MRTAAPTTIPAIAPGDTPVFPAAAGDVFSPSPPIQTVVDPSFQTVADRSPETSDHEADGLGERTTSESDGERTAKVTDVTVGIVDGSGDTSDSDGERTAKVTDVTVGIVDGSGNTSDSVAWNTAEIAGGRVALTAVRSKGADAARVAVELDSSHKTGSLSRVESTGGGRSEDLGMTTLAGGNRDARVGLCSKFAPASVNWRIVG